MAGEYLDSLGKTDLAPLSVEEWHTLIEVIVTGYCDHLRELAGQDRRPSRRHDGGGAVLMPSRASWSGSARGSLPTAIRSSRSSRAPRSRAAIADGGWRDYPGWTRHAARATTDLELSIWSRWPDAGVGIVGGPVAGIDIDIAEMPSSPCELEQLARERLGDTPALRIGRAPKRLLVYRTAAPFKGIRRHPLEVLCLGQQFVAYAIHPDTGRPYEWPDESLADLDIGDLPTIDEAAARAFLDEALRLVPEALKPARLATASTPGGASHAQAGTEAAIREALAWIPNPDLELAREHLDELRLRGRDILKRVRHLALPS